MICFCIPPAAVEFREQMEKPLHAFMYSHYCDGV